MNPSFGLLAPNVSAPRASSDSLQDRIAKIRKFMRQHGYLVKIPDGSLTEEQILEQFSYLLLLIDDTESSDDG